MTVPFDAQDVIYRLEDAAIASTLPKVSIFSIEKGFDKPIVENINNIINKWDNSGKLADVEQRIQHGIQNFDVQIEAEE